MEVKMDKANLSFARNGRKTVSDEIDEIKALDEFLENSDEMHSVFANRLNEELQSQLFEWVRSHPTAAEM